MHKKLVAQVAGDRGLTFELQPLANLELLLIDKETELATLKKAIPVIETELQKLTEATAHKSKIIYFHGKEGLEQVTWNSTKACGTLRIYEVAESMTAFLSQSFSEKVRQEFVTNKVAIKQLTNLRHIGNYTKVAELVDHYWEARFIDKKKLDIKFETLVYNDVLALYTFQEDELFCVEVHNPYLAQMQTQLFDFVWGFAKRMHIISSGGEAVLRGK